MKKVVTVDGNISPSELGITLPHEHLLWDFTCWCIPPDRFSKTPLIDAPVTLEILGDLRRDSLISKDNCRLYDVNIAISELTRYKKFGGSSLVDTTLPGIGRDPLAIRAISRATGVNVVCGTGWYVDASHPDYVKSKSVDELVTIMVRELTEGIDDTGIRTGVIGEIGCSDPLTKNERKVLQAAGRAQVKTGAPLNIHPALYNKKEERYVKKGGEPVDLIHNEGAESSKIYISHMDLTLSDLEYHRALIDKYGVTLSYDCFGNEDYKESYSLGMGGLSDRQRVKALVELLKSGYEKHLMVSSDTCSKMQLRKYGGYGYAHILENIVPMLQFEGITQKQIRTMLVENPKRILSW